MAATVFEEPRSNVLALPIFIAVLCVLATGSVAIHGIPADTQTRGALAVFAAGGVASVVWALRWRTIRLATISIDAEHIVFTPRGRRPDVRTIARRPDSKLRLVIASTGSASPTSRSYYVIFDERAGQPRITIDAFGKDRVVRACTAHGWVVEKST